MLAMLQRRIVELEREVRANRLRKSVGVMVSRRAHGTTVKVKASQATGVTATGDTVPRWG